MTLSDSGLYHRKWILLSLHLKKIKKHANNIDIYVLNIQIFNKFLSINTCCRLVLSILINLKLLLLVSFCGLFRLVLLLLLIIRHKW